MCLYLFCLFATKFEKFSIFFTQLIVLFFKLIELLLAQFEIISQIQNLHLELLPPVVPYFFSFQGILLQEQVLFLQFIDIIVKVFDLCATNFYLLLMLIRLFRHIIQLSFDPMPIFIHLLQLLLSQLDFFCVLIVFLF